MNTNRRMLLLGLAAASLGGAARVPLAAAQGRALATSELVIVTADGERHRFQVEMAADDASRARGLMFRKQLPRDGGMLFDYGPGERSVAMWMKNTLIPLDMLFIRADGTIRRIAERTVPHSLASIASGGPVQAVLEVAGGTASRLGIRAGDRVLHPVFGNAEAG